MQETTKDEDSGHYNTFVETDVLKLITKEGRAEFGENFQKVKIEISDGMKKLFLSENEEYITKGIKELKGVKLHYSKLNK